MPLFRSKKSPSLLDAWKQDADDFGLSENAQKGLIFLIALKSRIDPNLQSPEKLLGRAQKICDRISLNPPHIPEDLGGGFYDGAIELLLTELAERAHGIFESREIVMPGGDKVTVWNRGEKDQLPSSLHPETSLMSDWEEILTSLCVLIGEKINDDLDEAFIDGFHMFESYYPMDTAGTVQIIQTATSLFPPHFFWLDWCLDFSAEMLAKGNPVNKVLQSFLGPMDPTIMHSTMIFSDNLHYQGPGEKRQSVWDAHLPVFTLIAGSAQVGFCEQNSVELVDSARQILQSQGFEPPSICSSTDKIATVLQQQVRETWGYDVLSSEEAPSLGAQYTRRACISLLCVANGILQPTWNRVAQP
ncbi:MAG TPA: hypothetical protein DDW68_04710 [Verrucomicrobiales bacterium]|nr:hypothetical protein [Verrucomicrobiales bacterium]